MHSTVAPHFVQNKFFSLKVFREEKATKIVMCMKIAQLTTDNYPETFDILKTEFPGVLKTKCFNQQNLPFRKEVKNTEIGHLFEHILLEQLKTLKIATGARRVIYDGLTSWNWVRDKRGTFNIKITSGARDLEIFPEALSKAIALTQTILESQKQELILSTPTLEMANTPLFA